MAKTKKDKVMYLVGKRTFEYNDEVYTQRGKGVEPVVVFSSFQKASEELLKVSIAQLRNYSLDSIAYGFEDAVCNEDRLSEILNRYDETAMQKLRDSVENCDGDSNMLPDLMEKMTPPDQLAVLECLNYSFAEIVEVEVQ